MKIDDKVSKVEQCILLPNDKRQSLKTTQSIVHYYYIIILFILYYIIYYILLLYTFVKVERGQKAIKRNKRLDQLLWCVRVRVRVACACAWRVRVACACGVCVWH